MSTMYMNRVAYRSLSSPTDDR